MVVDSYTDQVAHGHSLDEILQQPCKCLLHDPHFKKETFWFIRHPK